jgi:hypothetical protein
MLSAQVIGKKPSETSGKINTSQEKLVMFTTPRKRHDYTGK